MYIGDTLAIFRLSGNILCSMLIFIIWAIGLAITGAAILRSLGPIISTPADMEGLSLFNNLNTLSSVIVHNEKVWKSFN